MSEEQKDRISPGDLWVDIIDPLRRPIDQVVKFRRGLYVLILGGLTIDETKVVDLLNKVTEDMVSLEQKVMDLGRPELDRQIIVGSKLIAFLQEKAKESGISEEVEQINRQVRLGEAIDARSRFIDWNRKPESIFDEMLTPYGTRHYPIHVTDVKSVVAPWYSFAKNEIASREGMECFAADLTLSFKPGKYGLRQDTSTPEVETLLNPTLPVEKKFSFAKHLLHARSGDQKDLVDWQISFFKKYSSGYLDGLRWMKEVISEEPTTQS